MKSATESPAITDNGQIDFDEILRKYDSGARYRTPSGAQALFVSVLAVGMAIFHLYTSGFGLLPIQMQGAVHLSFALSLTILLYPPRPKHGCPSPKA